MQKKPVVDRLRASSLLRAHTMYETLIAIVDENNPIKKYHYIPNYVRTAEIVDFYFMEIEDIETFFSKGEYIGCEHAVLDISNQDEIDVVILEYGISRLNSQFAYVTLMCTPQQLVVIGDSFSPSSIPANRFFVQQVISMAKIRNSDGNLVDMFYYGRNELDDNLSVIVPIRQFDTTRFCVNREKHRMAAIIEEARRPEPVISEEDDDSDSMSDDVRPY